MDAWTLAFTRKESASPFLTLLLTFTCVTILYLKTIKPDFVTRRTVLVDILWLSIFTRSVCQLIITITRVWMVANLKDFSPTVWTSQLVDPLSPFFFKLKKNLTNNLVQIVEYWKLLAVRVRTSKWSSLEII